jgi:flavin-dependent dehydrogenase
MDRDCDVLIVGGGPAGTSIALALAREHRALADRTLLVEAAVHPRTKPCGGVISGRALDVVARLVGPVGVLSGLPVRRVQVRYGEQMRLHTLPRAALAVDRRAFDATLMAAVRRQGLRVRESTRLVGLERRSERWRALLQGPAGCAEVTPRVVVGADGAFGAVRRLSGLPRGLSRARLSVTDRPVQPVDPPADTLVFELPTEPWVAGYYWSFPAPRAGGVVVRNHGVFHYGRRPPHRLGALLARRLPIGPAPRSSVQRLFQPGLPCSAPGVGLVGEAVGADPLSGEGIAQALVAGERAAALLWDHFDRGDFSLRGWSGRVLGSEARLVGVNAWLALLAYGPWQRGVSERVLASPLLADVALRRFCGLRHSPAERLALLRRVVTTGGLW